jgi:S1-C subfamily serine protease
LEEVVAQEPAIHCRGKIQRARIGHVWSRDMHRLLSLFVAVLFLGLPVARAGEINACKYLVVSDFTSDPYGIAKELRAQASAQGFVVVSSVSEAPASDVMRVCVMTGSWARIGLSGGEVSVRIADAASGTMIGEAIARGTDWWGVGRTVRKVVEKLYKQLGYTGFDEATYRQRIQRLFPPRPMFAVTEDEITKSTVRSAIEGVWTDPRDQYRLGIVPATGQSGADYFAVILRSTSPVWQPNEIKAEIRSTADPTIFTCTYFMADKKPVGTTLTLQHNAMLHGTLATSKGPFDLVLMRVWPKISDGPAGAVTATAGSSGTGFLLSRSGLIATNWHVVANATNISVAFPGWTDPAKAELVVRDAVNDLAVLRLSDATKLASTCSDLPFQLASAREVTLGEHVSTIGYPLTPMLGSSPKFTEGVVSSKSGFQDDPTRLQISAEVQPGSSGSPLFDSDGNIIGVVVATLDVAKTYQAASAIPQNVNFAIKADYLFNLAEMVPGFVPAQRTTGFSPDKASQCIAIVRAW